MGRFNWQDRGKSDAIISVVENGVVETDEGIAENPHRIAGIISHVGPNKRRSTNVAAILLK